MYVQVYTTGPPIKAFEYQVFPRNRPTMFARTVGVARARRKGPGRWASSTIIRDCTERKRCAAGAGQGQGGCGSRESREERFSGQHEPRNPHADEWHHRHDGAGPRYRPDALSGRLPRRRSKSSAESLLTILNDILDFSKIEQPLKLELEAVAFSLADRRARVVAPLSVRAHQTRARAAVRHRARRAGRHRRRSGPAEADCQQPGRQRDQVHRARPRRRVGASETRG